MPKQFKIINSQTDVDGFIERDNTTYIWADDVSDNYHTMDELYEHKYALFYALIKIYDNYITPMGTRIKCWKSKVHSDETMFDDSFIVGMTIPDRSFEPDKPPSYITYHYPVSWWTRFNVITLPNAPEWDGHTSDDVIERLMNL